jgi:hypothetical protein
VKESQRIRIIGRQKEAINTRKQGGYSSMNY